MIFKILGAPITVPMAGFNFVLRQVLGMAEKELYDPQRIREDLLLLQLRLEEGAITEEEYKVQEAEVMARLRAARAYNEQQGGGQ